MLSEDIELGMLAGHVVNFVYLAPDGSETDKQLLVRCHFLPRPGDYVVPDAGSSKVPVKSVYHRFMKDSRVDPDHYCQVVTVVLADPGNVPST